MAPDGGLALVAMFVSWVLDKAGIGGFKHAYTPAGAEMFRQRWLWFGSGPRPGDVVYFDFPDSLHRIQHVGMVEKVNGDGTVTTIEGNTSSSAAGSQDNGGGVYRRQRTASLIAGYGRPPYSDSPKPSGGEQRFREKAWFGRGDSGADVRIWQRQLNLVIEADLVVDGIFGPDTTKATRAFERQFGLKADGKVDKDTIKAMEDAFAEAKVAKGGKPPMLELYDTGRWVKTAQQLLIAAGYPLNPDGADGDFGPVTAKAVRRFKLDRELPDTPVLGPRAWRLLDSA